MIDFPPKLTDDMSLTAKIDLMQRYLIQLANKIQDLEAEIDEIHAGGK